MPPPKGTWNPLEGPGDYDTTTKVHSDTYEAINPSQFDFHDRVVFISGGTKGIGKAMALSFAKAGASGIAIGARSIVASFENEIKEAAKTAGKKEPKVLALTLDVADQASTEAAAAAVKDTFGHCDILINNAGTVGQPAPIASSSPDAWWQTWNVNLRGVYLMTRAFLPLVQASHEKTIINVSSVGAYLTMPGMSSYQTTKLALLRFTEFTQVEHGEQGIIAFAIHPGNVQTDLAASLGPLPDAFKKGRKTSISSFLLSTDSEVVITESPEISADSLVYLTSKRREWLGGRYVNVTWDMPELMEKESEIVAGDKLKVRLVV